MSFSPVQLETAPAINLSQAPEKKPGVFVIPEFIPESPEVEAYRQTVELDTAQRPVAPERIALRGLETHTRRLEHRSDVQSIESVSAAANVESAREVVAQATEQSAPQVETAPESTPPASRSEELRSQMEQLTPAQKIADILGVGDRLRHVAHAKLISNN